MSQPANTHDSRLAGLDGLRGVACLMVFLYHLRWNAQPSNVEPLVLAAGSFNAEFLLRKFDIGVAIFFVLSGLLLSLPFWRAILAQKPMPDTTQYLWRRMCRIVPAYYAVLIAVYLLRGGTYTFFGALDFLLHATFLHPFADYAYYGAHPDLWTIGIEFQFYFLLPIIMRCVAVAFQKIGGPFAIALLIAVCWGVDFAAVALLKSLAPMIPDRFLSADGPVLTGTIFSYLKLFAFGIAAAYAVLRAKCSEAFADAVCAVAMLSTIALITFGEEAAWRSTGPLGWPLNAIILAVLAASLARSRYFARALSTRWIAATGTISYGIYLWHDLILHAVFAGTLRGNLSGWLLFLTGGSMALVVTLFIATLSWRFIERDALRKPFPFPR
jgi:peptidoglycan/LPS O-acetylase OafA/YrhL